MISEREFEKIGTYYPVLEMVPVALQQAIRADGQRLVIPQGRMLLDIDSGCHSFVMLASGVIRVTKQASSGREMLLYRLQPGDSCILTVSCSSVEISQRAADSAGETSYVKRRN